MSTENDIRALEDSMRRWGVDPERNEAHRLYWKTMKASTREYIHGTGVSKLKEYEESTLMSLPQDPGQGVSTVCRDGLDRLVTSMKNLSEEEKEEGYQVTIVDLLQEAYPSMGFGTTPYDKAYSSGSHGLYDLKPKFYNIENDNPLLLDPFVRFSPKSTDSLEKCVRQQYLEEGSPGCIGGCNALVLLGLVCHTVCNPDSLVKCVGCQRTQSLKWNGGPLASIVWRKMECSHCGAIYEFKTVPNLRKKMDHQNPRIDNGTVFHAYHHLRREQPERQMFLVMVDSWSFKAASRNDVATPSYPPPTKICAYVAKISHVAPQLKPKSFINFVGASTYHLYTKIFVRHMNPWFDISLESYPDEMRHPTQSFVAKVIDDYFLDPKDSVEKSHSPENDKGSQSDNTNASRIGSMSLENLSSYFVELRTKRARIAFLENIEPESRSAEDAKLIDSLEEISSEILLCEEAHRKFM